MEANLLYAVCLGLLRYYGIWFEGTQGLLELALQRASLQGPTDQCALRLRPHHLHQRLVSLRRQSLPLLRRSVLHPADHEKRMPI